jgi:hypothetical protein
LPNAVKIIIRTDNDMRRLGWQNQRAEAASRQRSPSRNRARGHHREDGLDPLTDGEPRARLWHSEPHGAPTDWAERPLLPVLWDISFGVSVRPQIGPVDSDHAAFDVFDESDHGGQFAIC